MTQPRRFRWLRFLFGTLLILVLGVLLAGWYLIAGSRAQLDGEVRLRGPKDAVCDHPRRAGYGDPEGQSRDDVSFALGYVHGQERFFAMDLMRRLPAGELSELVGAKALDTDINHRRHRLRSVAEAAYAHWLLLKNTRWICTRQASTLASPICT